MSNDVKKEKKDVLKPVEDDSDNQTSGEADDEFVSDLHQASSKDLAEADEAMKKLGLSKVKFQQKKKLTITSNTSIAE